MGPMYLSAISFPVPTRPSVCPVKCQRFDCWLTILRKGHGDAKQPPGQTGVCSEHFPVGPCIIHSSTRPQARKEKRSSKLSEHF